MPLYEYKCPSCGDFELIRKFSDAPLAHCPTCGAAVQKLLSASAFHFKGTGWYVTDYAKRSGGPSGASEGAKSEGARSESAGSESAKSESGESKKAESKGAATTESKPSTASGKTSD